MNKCFCVNLELIIVGFCQDKSYLINLNYKNTKRKLGATFYKDDSGVYVIDNQV